MSSIEDTDLADVGTADTETLAAARMTPKGRFYEHIDSQQITEYVPPNSSRSAWQVRGVEPNTGIVFLGIVNDKAFRNGNYVAPHMNRIGHILYVESQVPNVVGISVRQVTNNQLQQVNELDVSVQSTSGNSTGRITVPYPNPADLPGSVAHFTALVKGEVAVLDANEGN
jgi:hypothetical protein